MDLAAEIFLYLLPTLSLGLVLLLLLLFIPEKLEKWWALFLKVLAALGWIFRAVHKQYVKHNLQGRMNTFLKTLRKVAPSLAAKGLRIEWVDRKSTRQSFIDRDRVILRLRRDDPADHNFIHGVYLFTAETLLSKAKRYVSQNQRSALDLFVCSKILQSQKPALRTFFLDEYLHPETENPLTRGYVDDFAIIDRKGFVLQRPSSRARVLGREGFWETSDSPHNE